MTVLQTDTEPSDAEIREAVDKIASPILLTLLKGWGQDELTKGIADNGSIAEELRKNRVWMGIIGIALYIYPNEAKRGAKKYALQDKWINYWIDNHLKEQRPDLYFTMISLPNGFNWLRRQVKELADLFLS